MWTRGKDKDQAGAFAFELWDGFDLIASEGGFSTAAEADRAAEAAQRAHLFPAAAQPMTDTEFAEIEALLAELAA